MCNIVNLIKKCKKYIIYAVIGITAITFVYLAESELSSRKIAQNVLNETLKKNEQIFNEKMKQKDDELSKKDKELSILNDKLNKSQIEYKKIVKNVTIIKKEVENIDDPKDITEIKNRLRSMGYNIK